MTKGFKKKESKRMSTRKRVKIERKVKEHNRKERKKAKKSNTIQHAKRKDPGIPNSLPFKEEILKEAEDRKKRIEEEKQKQKDRARKERDKQLNKKRNLEQLVKDAQKRTAEFNKINHYEKKEKAKETREAPENSLKTYYKEFKKVVEAADVIFQVLDARDPLGSRCPQVEEAVLNAGHKKRLVLLLNKIDLVPKENVEAWLKHLRNEFPTLAFKASTQTQADNLSQVKVPVARASEDLMKSSRCLGADMVLKLLGNYCRNQAIKTSITVGIVGFPNTGKSSIINSLKRSRACNVGATPGVTKQMQEVHLDKNIKLLDSPGIVMATGNSDAEIILRNCVKIETVEDPVTPVASILRRCSKHQMMLHYNVPDFKDANEFLALLAKRFGKLKKGGVPDVNRAGKQVLQDWNHGKITFYTHPPESSSMATHVSAEIVTSMSQGFDLDALMNDEQSALETLKSRSTTDIVIESIGPMSAASEADMDSEEEEDEDEDEEMSEDEAMEEQDEGDLKSVTINLPTEKPAVKTTPESKMKNKNRWKKNKKSKQEEKEDKLMEVEGLVQLNKNRKQEFKKMKKQRRKADNLGNKLGDAMETAFASLGNGDKSSSDNYNFSTDFGL